MTCKNRLILRINSTNNLSKHHPIIQNMRKKKFLETCKRIYRRDIDSAKKLYYFMLFNNYKTDMKQTWSIINNFCEINNKEVNIP